MEDAEECVNGSWNRAWDTMPPRRPNSLRAYLVRITRNLSIDRWRAKRAEKRRGGLDVLLDELEDCLPAASGAEELTAVPEDRASWFKWRKWGAIAAALVLVIGGGQLYPAPDRRKERRPQRCRRRGRGFGWGVHIHVLRGARVPVDAP